MFYDYVCSKCKNNNISFDGNVKWSKESQCFDLDDVFGCTYCNDCEDEVSINKIAVSNKSLESNRGNKDISMLTVKIGNMKLILSSLRHAKKVSNNDYYNPSIEICEEIINKLKPSKKVLKCHVYKDDKLISKI